MVKGPDEAKIQEILKRTGYKLDVTTGQRKYGGPPPNWEGEEPVSGCEVSKVPIDDIFKNSSVSRSCLFVREMAALVAR